MFVTNTDLREIMSIVDMLKSNSSKSNDDITSSIIKDVISEIALSLTLQNCQFPEKIKSLIDCL